MAALKGYSKWLRLKESIWISAFTISLYIEVLQERESINTLWSDSVNQHGQISLSTFRFLATFRCGHQYYSNQRRYGAPNSNNHELQINV